METSCSKLGAGTRTLRTRPERSHSYQETRHTDPTIFTHCIKAVGSRHYVDGWSLSDAHGRRVRYTDLPERIPTGILRGTVLQCGDCGGGMEHPTL